MVGPSILPEDRSAAVISDDGLYRYELERWWGRGPGVLWIMLNPSTADAEQDDATIRLCRGFTRRWGHSGFGVVNLFAYRATHPADLAIVADPIGPHNEHFIRRWLQWDQISLVVAAWGAWRMPSHFDSRPIDQLIRDVTMRRPLWCLGKTAGGEPRHPRGVRADQPLLPWHP